MDVYDCVLVIRSQKALDSFATHKATLGAEIGLAAGPYGAGAAMEAGKEKAPVFSYIRSRGLYAGLEIMGQVFVERADENASMYHWPGIKAGDIVSDERGGGLALIDCTSYLERHESPSRRLDSTKRSETPNRDGRNERKVTRSTSSSWKARTTSSCTMAR